MTKPYGSSDDDRLDAEQAAAVTASERSIAVLAGPGSGKTRSLSLRTRHLLDRDPGSHALLLTFTNKAAAEMKARALRVGGLSSKRLQACTFHTFCAEVLRSHGDLVGVAKDFDILDAEEQREIASAAGGNDSALRSWGESRLRRVNAPAAIAPFGGTFQRLKRERGVVDFDDLLLSVATLFEQNPLVTKAYAAKFRHLLIDEFQDTSAAQFAVVEALSAHAQTVSIFADDDQAIFGFAGAEAQNVQRFIRQLGAKVYPLTTNYRSGDRIVEVANRLIASDPARSGRRMRAHAAGGEVELRRFANESEEAAFIAADIASGVSRGRSMADSAVLVRSGRRAAAIVRELGARGIPVTDWRGDTHVPADRRLLAAGLAVVRGMLSIRHVARLAQAMGVSETAALSTDDFLKRHAAQPLVRGLGEVRRLAFAGASPHSIAVAVQRAFEAQDKVIGQSLQSMVDAVGQFELYDKEFTLEHLLGELALGSVGRPPTEGGGVRVASLHRTKGLQWKVVYLIGLEANHLPDFRATPSTMSEERRLCFVGVSRAEARLVVTTSAVTSSHVQQASPFLKEMGLEQ